MIFRRSGAAVATAAFLWIVTALGFPLQASAQQQQFWYYCDAAQAYYPYVQHCASSWRAVPAVPQDQQPAATAQPTPDPKPSPPPAPRPRPASAPTSASRAAAPAAQPAEETDATTPSVCCKVCSKGYACGNSCISRSYVCHKPPGCACDE